MMQKVWKRVAVVAALGVLVSGCSMFDSVGGWFSAPSKSKLKGERISILTNEDALKPDPTLADTRVVLPKPYRNSEWPEPGGYASNAMYHLEATGPLQQIWDVDAGKGSDIDSRLTAPPIVAAGRVYVLDAAAHVRAFNAQTGEKLWEADVAPKGGEPGFFNSASFGLIGSSNRVDPTKGFGGGVAFDNGRVFVSSGFGDVVALNAADGKQIWKTPLGVPIVNAPVANGGRVFVSSQDNHFYALAQSDGRKLWDHQGITESAGILESTSAAVAGEFVIVPYTSGELFAIRVQNGRPAWNDMLTRSGTVTALSELDDIAGRPVVDRDLVFAISHSGIMAAINLSTGGRSWSRDIGGTVGGGRLGLCPDHRQPAFLPSAQGWAGEVDSPDAALGRSGRQKRPHRLVRAGAGIEPPDRAVLHRQSGFGLPLYGPVAWRNRHSGRYDDRTCGGQRHSLSGDPRRPPGGTEIAIPGLAFPSPIVYSLRARVSWRHACL